MSVGHFVGIDPSLTSTGVCILDANSTIVKIVALSAGKKESGMRRLESLRFQILKTLAPYPTIRSVCVEGYSYNSKGGRAFSIGEWGGLLRWTLYERNLPVYQLSPSSLKKFATGRGVGDKSAMIMAAYKRFDIDLSGRDDEADALWLAYAGKQATFPFGEGPPLTQAQKDGLKSIERLESRRSHTSR